MPLEEKMLSLFLDEKINWVTDVVGDYEIIGQIFFTLIRNPNHSLKVRRLMEYMDISEIIKNSKVKYTNPREVIQDILNYMEPI